MRPVVPRQPVDHCTVPVPHGEIFVLPDRCKGCRFCIEFCPKDVLAESEAMNARGYHYPVVVPGHEDACAQCEFCMLICPEFAIFVEARAALAEVAP